MKHPVKTLSALALAGAMAPAFGASIKDDQMSLAFKGNIQVRANLLNDGSSATGGDWDPLRGQAGQAESLRFDVRRARFGFEAKMGDWKGVLTIRADKNDTAANAGGNEAITPASGGGGRPLQLYYANITRTFKLEDGMAIAVKGGLDKAYNAESSISSSTFLFPSDTVVDERIEQRNVGVAGLFTSAFVNAGLDLQNNSTGVKDPEAQSAAGSTETNGLYYSGRIEFSPVAEWMPLKKMQSFVGKEGTHLVIGLDYQTDDKNITTNAVATSFVVTKTVAYGPDILFHWNGLTAYGEFRQDKITADTVTDATGATATADTKGQFYNIQAAYAMPVSDIFVEPAIRYSKVDSNKNVTNNSTYGGGGTGTVGNNIDNGGDGRTIDVGVNLYFDGHNNKLSIAYQNWKAEGGSGDASIIRIQQQINF